MRRRSNEQEESGAGQVEAGEQGFAELGRHVATVLATAREAAEKIQRDAQREAERILAEARDKAAEMVARAERQARDLIQAAQERQQELDANVERTEERLRKLVAGLRDLAGRLDVLVGEDALDEALQRQVEAEAAAAREA
jgi:cell division initiation protein